MKDYIEIQIDKIMKEEIDKRVCKDDANYGKAVTCDRCTFFIPLQNKCRKVLGTISSLGICDYLEIAD
jgi:hypothetical protein